MLFDSLAASAESVLVNLETTEKSDIRTLIIGREEKRIFIANLTLLEICLGVSVKKIDEFVSDALILESAPCKAGKKVEWTNAGLGKLQKKRMA